MKNFILIMAFALTGLMLPACKDKVKTETETTAVGKYAPFDVHLKLEDCLAERIASQKQKNGTQFNKGMFDSIEYCGYFWTDSSAAAAAQLAIDNHAHTVYSAEDFPPGEHYFQIFVMNDLISNLTWYHILYDDLTMEVPGLESTECKWMNVSE